MSPVHTILLLFAVCLRPVYGLFGDRLPLAMTSSLSATLLSDEWSLLGGAEDRSTYLIRRISLPLNPLPFPVVAPSPPALLPCRLTHHTSHLFDRRIDAEQTVRDVLFLVADDGTSERCEDGPGVVRKG